MAIIDDIQTFDPGSLIELFELDATELGGGIIRFHASANGPIFWQGQQYDPWPIGADGFARTSQQQPVPRLTVGNTDGSISLLCIIYDDMLGMVLTRRRTLGKYLDAVNFPGGVNPTADPGEEFPPEKWYINRKATETRDAVTFELGSPLDFSGVKLPRRQIIANQCPWAYRGPGCAYIGPPVAMADDTPTSDPALDRCGKRLQSCRLRIWPDDIKNFGGFPAAGLMRT